MIRFHVWFLAVALVGGPLAAGLVFGFDELEEQARRAGMAALLQDAARAEARVAQLADDLARQAAQAAERAAIDQELLPLAAGTGNPLEIRDRVKAALERTAAPGDLVAVADVRGAIVLRLKEAKEDFQHATGLTAALKGLPRTDVVSYRGGLYQIAAVPILSGAQIVGAMLLGRNVATLWVDQLRGDRDSGVAVVLGGKVLASNIAARERGELPGALARLRPGRPDIVTLGGERFAAHLSPAPGVATAAVVHVRLERTMLSNVTDLREKYAYAAGGVFLLAIFWAFLLQRAIWRPAAILAARIKTAADGGDQSVSSADLPSPWSVVAGAVSGALARIRARVTDVAMAKAEAAAAIARAAAEVAEAKAEAERARAEVRAVSTAPLEAPAVAGEESPAEAAAPAEAAPPAARTLYGIGPPAAEPLVGLSESETRTLTDSSAAPAPDALHGAEALPTQEISAIYVPPPPRETTAVTAPPRDRGREMVRDPLEVELPELHRRFLAARRECAEPTDEVTFDRFARKVRALRDELREAHRCEAVHFEVFVRDGRASLRARPEGGPEASRPTVH